uniref:tRNA(Ile)-lysidine synthase, chloroplastic n=1 Tax=Dasya naccarioides TaxID=2007180 RepID=A0A1Z1MGJ4_9FLOR|nr:tRNA Ile-lysidine synthetase [Dasya naccarioides]ARW65123.1 tRNA Ile-lysidine synthetase [Dasya naccarioides]
MTKYFEKIMNHIIKKYQINSLLIAISGGQDSICLIKLLEQFNKQKNSIKKFEYLYIDHQWKKDSKIQAEYLINYMKQQKKKFSIYQIKKISISENTSRIYRYNTIIDHAMQNKYDAIITAHTKTDKLETFIQNLGRGTTIEGATSLNSYNKLNQKLYLFRPLISNHRQELNFFCRKYFLPIWSDNTNYNYSIKRNRIRYEVIPYLNKYLNKKIESNLVNFLESCYHDHEYIKQISIINYINNKHYRYIALNYRNIQNNHIAIQTRIIQLFINHNLYIFIHKYFLYQLLKIINRKINTTIKWKKIKFEIKTDWIYITVLNEL